MDRFVRFVREKITHGYLEPREVPWQVHDHAAPDGSMRRSVLLNVYRALRRIQLQMSTFAGQDARAH